MTEKATSGQELLGAWRRRFSVVPGVLDTRVGYSGGETPNPTYKDVCTEEKGQAEGCRSVRSGKKAMKMPRVFGKIARPDGR